MCTPVFRQKIIGVVVMKKLKVNLGSSTESLSNTTINFVTAIRASAVPVVVKNGIPTDAFDKSITYENTITPGVPVVSEIHAVIGPLAKGGNKDVCVAYLDIDPNNTTLLLDPDEYMTFFSKWLSKHTDCRFMEIKPEEDRELAKEYAAKLVSQLNGPDDKTYLAFAEDFNIEVGSAKFIYTVLVRMAMHKYLGCPIQDNYHAFYSSTIKYLVSHKSIKLVRAFFQRKQTGSADAMKLTRYNIWQDFQRFIIPKDVGLTGNPSILQIDKLAMKTINLTYAPAETLYVKKQ